MTPPPQLSMMQPTDMAEVIAVERASYSAGWPSTAFERELTQNAMARYVVLRHGQTSRVEGFAGLWLMVDEAHVVTVAVLPDVRRLGYGRALVHALMAVAIGHDMAQATLEVRESNEAARNLYKAFGFYEVGKRKRYYSDNREDAVIMTTEDIQSEPYARRLRLEGERLQAAFPGIELRPAGLD
ncbi:MAG: ribosomal protein S18-alanine N-acetyltransferase [Dehalococcoidia bacterium]